MNVTCTGCPAKYAVPDEKVRGKKVRITCKHCGTNIVVDGSTLGADQSTVPKPAEAAKPAAAVKAAEPAKAAAPAESSYLVGFTDERQETLTVSEIVSQYASSKLDDETLVWKDGMADWLAPFDVPEIATAMLKRGVTKRATPFSLASATDDEPTVVGRSPFDEDNTEISSAPKPELDFLEPAKPAAALRKSAPELKFPAAAAAIPKPAAQATKPAAAAARRAEKRPGADLFGSVADAGSESDASLDLGFPTADEDHKLTGARNESSVLFSLDALTKPDPKAANQKKAREKEQEKEANLLFGDSAPNSLVNLGGGGGLSALAAPDFSKPYVPPVEAQVRPSDPVEVPNSAPEKKKGAGIWVVAVLGIAAAAGVAFFMMQKKNAEKAATPVAQETKAAAAPVSPTTPEPAVASAAPEAPAASAEGPSPAELAAQAITAAGAKAAASAAPGTPATPVVNKPAATPAAAVAAAAETKKPETPAATNAPAPAAAGAAFDKGAAVSALGAAAANAASCKKPDGPTGSGKVSVTFAPSGRATMTNVSGGSYAGTDVGGCVARLFRAAKVPAFDGDPVTVSKSFSIE